MVTKFYGVVVEEFRREALRRSAVISIGSINKDNLFAGLGGGVGRSRGANVGKANNVR